MDLHTVKINQSKYTAPAQIIPNSNFRRKFQGKNSLVLPVWDGKSPDMTKNQVLLDEKSILPTLQSTVYKDIL